MSVSDHVHDFRGGRGLKKCIHCDKTPDDECRFGHPRVNEDGTPNFRLVGQARRCITCERNRSRTRLDSRTPEEHERDKERVRESSQRLRDERKKTVFDHYGRVCRCCGETAPEFLCIDHVNGGGNEHRRTLTKQGLGSHPVYKWLVENGLPDGFQTLCHNCNYAKHVYGTCPHRRPTR